MKINVKKYDGTFVIIFKLSRRREAFKEFEETFIRIVYIYIAKISFFNCAFTLKTFLQFLFLFVLQFVFCQWNYFWIFVESKKVNYNFHNF